MNIKIMILILFFGSTLMSFEPPRARLKKRAAPEEIEIEEITKAPRGDISESEGELPSSVAEKVEDVQEDPSFLLPTGLQDLPNELVLQLAKLISTAKGPTNIAKLYVASANIRNFAQINKDFYNYFIIPRVHLEILRKLAQTYAKGSILAAAVALATDQASKLIGSTINESMEYDDETELLKVEKPEDQENVKEYKEYLLDAIKHQQLDTWRFLTKYLQTPKLAFLIDSLIINDMPVLLYLIDSKDSDDKKMLAELFKIDELNFNIKDRAGRTPLIAAIKAEDAELLNFLLGIESNDVNVANNNGSTPLMFAISQQNQPFVNLLLENGAQVNILNRKAESPLTLAISKDNVPLVERLLAVDGINVNLIGNTPTSAAALHWATYKGNPIIVRALLNKEGIQINLPNAQGDIALHLAAKKQHDQIVDLLIRNGALVNIQDLHGMTPLMYAARTDNQKSISYLINPPANADLTLTDVNGHTALWHARNAGNVVNIRILQNVQAQE